MGMKISLSQICLSPPQRGKTGLRQVYGLNNSPLTCPGASPVQQPRTAATSTLKPHCTGISVQKMRLRAENLLQTLMLRTLIAKSSGMG
jgi:hypothetical protein